MFTSLLRGTSKLFIMESNEFLISTQRVDGLSATKPYSSLTRKLGGTKHLKTDNYGRSVISVHSSMTKLNAIQFFKSVSKLYSRNVLTAVLRRLVVCLEMEICEATFYNAALFGSKTLSRSPKYIFNNLSLPIRSFCNANIPGNNKTILGHIISFISKSHQN